MRLSRAANQHTHQSNEIFKFSAEAQQLIKDMFDVGLKPKAIRLALVNKGHGAPPANKLETFLKNLKKERFGGEKLNVGSLEKWLSNQNVAPDDDTTPFILDYAVETTDDEGQTKFRFFATTKLLLKNAIGVKKIHCDATYKLIWQGYPVLIIGTTDLQKRFHCFGAAVCSNEKALDFEFIFRSVQTGVRNIYGSEISPDFLICDGATAIHNAFRNVFGDDKSVIMCWAHMYRAVSNRLNVSIKDTTKRAKFLTDLSKLQVSKSVGNFEIASKLFVAKWKLESDSLMSYFEDEWLKKHPNWFEAFARQVPSTNNALEAFNRVIKSEHTFRERLDISQFRFVLYKMLNSLSVEYESGLNAVENECHKIDTSLDTLAYNWANLNFKLTPVKEGEYKSYRVPAGLADIELNDAQSTWESFDSFVGESFSYYTTRMPENIDRTNWMTGDCDCASFHKDFMCLHIVGIATRLKCKTTPPEAKQIPLGAKRRRGRPALAKGALTKQ